jgi:hypothetical protein
MVGGAVTGNALHSKIEPTQLIAIIVMAATLCGIVHSYSFYLVFGINFFEIGARDDFILAALRSPASLLLVLITWLWVAPRHLNVLQNKLAAFLWYFLVPAFLVAALGVAQAWSIRNGKFKALGTPVCSIYYLLKDGEPIRLDGVTPLGNGGSYMVLWKFRDQEVQLLSTSALKSINCALDD